MTVKVLHNGQNDFYKRQFFSFGSTLPKLEIKQFVKVRQVRIDFFSYQLTGVKAAYYNLTEFFFVQIISVMSNAKFPILKSR